MTKEEELIAKIQQMCDADREAEVIEMIDGLPEEEKTYKILGLQARTLSNYAGMIRNGYVESGQNPADCDRRALQILTDTAEEGKEDPNWWCRNGYTRMGLGLETEAIPYFEHVMTLIDDDPETQEFWSDVPEAIRECRRIIGFLEHPAQQAAPYAKQRSLMVVIPREENFTIDMERLTNYIKNIDGMTDMVFENTEGQNTATIERICGKFMGENFDAEIDYVYNYYPEGLFFSSYFNAADMELLHQRHTGYTIDLRTGHNQPLRWLQLQLRMAAAMVPDILSLCDISGNQILSGHWVRRTAESAVVPHPDFAFSINTEDNGRQTDTWLYTTGLQRFGIPDMEIMHSNAAHAECHRKLLTTIASYALWRYDDELSHDMRIGVAVAQMTGGVPLYIRLLPWPEAIKDGKRDVDTPGSIRRRLTRMNSDSCVVFAYQDEKAAEDDSYQPLWMMDDFLTNEHTTDTLFLMCEEEHRRMSQSAYEQLWLPEHVARICPQKVWLRLRIDDEDGEEEIIWTQLISYKDRQNFEVEIKDEPKFLGYEKGERLIFENDNGKRLIHWMIDTADFNIIPGSIYLLDAEPKLKKELGVYDTHSTNRHGMEK